MTISQQAVFHLHTDNAEPMPVRVRLSWDPTDPVAVQATFHTGRPNHEGDVTWAFSRDLLAAGILALTGAGDVRVGPGEPGELRIRLSSNSGRADFSCDVETIEGFLAATFVRVPAGSEFDDADLEAELFCLLLAEGQS